jgi:hypothetical protein
MILNEPNIIAIVVNLIVLLHYSNCTLHFHLRKVVSSVVDELANSQHCEHVISFTSNLQCTLKLCKSNVVSPTINGTYRSGDNGDGAL